MVQWSKARECGCFSSPSEQAPLLTAEDEELGEEEEENLPASVVQFSTSNFFCTEDEGFASVDVVRLGDASGSCRCQYRTEDGSAKAGVKFVGQSGDLEFTPGQTMQTIKIALLTDDAWDSTLEFTVYLPKVYRARRGQYLKRCVVSIVDNDAFPTNRYKAETQDQAKLAKLSGPALLLEYLKMNWRIQEVRNVTIMLAASDQIKNAYFLLTLYLQMYLVDVVLGHGHPRNMEARGHEDVQVEDGSGESAPHRILRGCVEMGAGALARALGELPLEDEEEPIDMAEEPLLVPGRPHVTAVIVALLYVVPFAATHFLDYLKWKLRLPGMLRKILQSALMRRFLTFTEDVRAGVSEGDISMAMTRDVGEVVECGYMKVIVLASALGKLFYAMMFVLSENVLATVPLAVFLVIGGIFLCVREQKTVAGNEEMANSQNHLVHLIHDIIERERLIADFQLRPYIVKRFESSIGQYNNRALGMTITMGNNSYLPPWITTVLVGGYMVIGTFQVKALGGKLSLGAYLATMAVFKEVGKEMSEIYMEVIEILKVAGPLRKLYYYMNQPTIMIPLLQRNRARRAIGKDRREQARRTHTIDGMGALRSDDGKYVFAADTLDIELQDVSFSFGSKLVIDSLTYKFRQGHFYAIIGPEQQGKATLLRILGGQLIPDVGTVFVPVHLRVLHMNTEALAIYTEVLRGSLLLNIIFDREVKDVGGLERVRRICTRCGFSDEALRLLDYGVTEDLDDKVHWARKFSSTDLARLNLARALVLNPEVLIMHMPFIAFSDTEANRMSQLLRAHIVERGLELSEEGRKFRRPRTVLYSSSTLDRCKQVDTIIEVTQEAGLREIPTSFQSWR